MEEEEHRQSSQPFTQQKPMKNTRYFEQSSASQAVKDDKEKSYINYRVKQKSRPPLSSKADLSEAGSSHPNKSKNLLKPDPQEKIKTEQLSHFQT